MKNRYYFFLLVCVAFLFTNCASSNYSHFGKSRHLPIAKDKGELELHAEINSNLMISADISYFVADHTYVDVSLGHAHYFPSIENEGLNVNGDEEFDLKIGIGIVPKEKFGIGLKLDGGIRNNKIFRGTTPNELSRKYFSMGLTPYAEVRGKFVNWANGMTYIYEKNKSIEIGNTTPPSFLDNDFTIMPKNQLDLFTSLRIKLGQANINLTIAYLFMEGRNQAYLEDYIEYTTQFRVNFGVGYKFQTKPKVIKKS